MIVGAGEGRTLDERARGSSVAVSSDPRRDQDAIASDAASSVDRLEAILFELDVGPAQLRRDPSGADWLPPEAQRMVEADPRCRAALREFVQDELALCRALDEPTVAPSNDAFFTRRVVHALPEPWSGTRLSPRSRALLLGSFHVVAGLLAYMVLTMAPESTARWAAQAHEVLSWGSEVGGGIGSSWVWVMAAGVGAVVLMAGLRSIRPRTPAA